MEELPAPRESLARRAASSSQEKAGACTGQVLSACSSQQEERETPALSGHLLPSAEADRALPARTPDGAWVCLRGCLNLLCTST